MTRTSSVSVQTTVTARNAVSTGNHSYTKIAVLSLVNIVLAIFKPLSDITENSTISSMVDNIPSDANRTICQCTFNGIEDILNICEYTLHLTETNEQLLFLFGIMSLIFIYKRIIEKFITAKNESIFENVNKEVCAFLTDNLFFTVICFVFIKIEPQIYAALPESPLVGVILSIMIVILFYLAFPVIVYLFCYMIMSVVYMGIIITANINAEIPVIMYVLISICAGIAIDYIATKIMFAFAQNSIRLR